MQVAMSCRDEMLCLGTGEAAGALPFLILSGDSRMPDNNGAAASYFHVEVTRPKIIIDVEQRGSSACWGFAPISSRLPPYVRRPMRMEK